jgi:2'-5' RNA ligase
MRVFAAMVLSVEAVHDLDKALAEHRSLLPSIRWTPSDDWHLALAYFGNISRTDLDRLEHAMAEITETWPPMEVRVQGLGAFPEPDEANALWAHVHEPNDLLPKLSSAVLAGVKGFGWILDRRVFRPQVMLGRSSQPVDAQPFLDAVGSYEGPSWTFDTIAALYPRPRDDETSEMDIVGTYPLAGPS